MKRVTWKVVDKALVMARAVVVVAVDGGGDASFVF